VITRSEVTPVVFSPSPPRAVTFSWCVGGLRTL